MVISQSEFPTVIYSLLNPVLSQDILQNHSFSIKYSDAFNNYNGNIRYFKQKKHIEFHLSKRWQTVSEEIVSGLLQSLTVKLFRKSNFLITNDTINIQLYNLFMKNLSDVAERKDSDEQLIAIYKELNEKYFQGFMEMPNLVWGNETFRKLGCYEYATDTVTISTILQDAPKELIASVVYHELLHKKHKFNVRNGKSFHHTPEFKKDESLFQNYAEVENQLKKYLSTKKRRFSWFHF
ncbi:M48 family metallopeptidase [Candidatus Woesearchaeota archaeon]|nr:M48 family metallopeptidase [Candidatus Woesearchaeota archaeon]